MTGYPHLAVLRSATATNVVQSPWWANGAAAKAGAVTFGNGTAGITGAVTTSNSLVGTTADDNVGLDSVKALTNGNYVVGSSLWDNGSNEDAGAATFGNGVTGIAGPVSTTNSLFGSAFDYVADGIEVLSNGNYVVKSPYWNNGAVSSAGAVTFGNGTTGTVGLVTSSNSSWAHRQTISLADLFMHWQMGTTLLPVLHGIMKQQRMPVQQPSVTARPG